MKPGDTFGRLTVIASEGCQRWSCACACGVRKIVHASNLRSGRTKSCGCLSREVASARSIRHGCSQRGATKATTEYRIWAGMIQRCSNPSNEAFHNYGARGVRVCDRWLKFEIFLADMGPRPAGKSIDRYPDNDGDYRPGNCRWATPVEQGENRRDVRLYEFAGERASLKSIARRIGMQYATLRRRVVYRGQSLDVATSTSVAPWGRK